MAIVNADMVWKPGKLRSFYNELRFYVELASPCINHTNKKIEQRHWPGLQTIDLD